MTDSAKDDKLEPKSDPKADTKSDGPKATNLQLEILASIKVSQNQNGLRHGDYERYRRYCSRRLRRIRKNLRFSHGKLFKQKKVDEKHVTDARWLNIPLYHAERAWSHAMQLKNDISRDSQRKKVHLVKRLSKASRWGRELRRLCATTTDPRTQLEAEAYSSWMEGNLLLERDNHKEAYTKFLRAKGVYKKLAKTLSGESRNICVERVQQLEPRLRYCYYIISKKGGSGKEDIKQGINMEGDMEVDMDAEDEEIDTTQGITDDLLKAKLDAVAAETIKKEVKTFENVTWLGRKVPVDNPKLKVLMLKAEDLGKNLHQSLEQEGKDEKKGKAPEKETKYEEESEKRFSQFQDLFSAYDDVIKFIREEQKSVGKEKESIQINKQKENLQALLDYSRNSKLKWTMERNLGLVRPLRHRFEQQDRSRGGQEKDTQASGSKKEKKVKADELIVLYERLIQNITDIGELAKGPSSSSSSSSKSAPTAGDPGLVKETEAKSLAFKALRAFYLAESYRRVKRWPEAYSLYQRCASQAKDSRKSADLLGEELLEDVTSVEGHTQSLSLFVHTHALLDLEKSSQKLSKDVKQKLVISDEQGADGEDADASNQYLLDRLDLYKTGPASSQYKLTPFPPQFQTAPCKPILFDLAFNHLQSPSLSHRIPKTKAKAAEVKKDAKSETKKTATDSKKGGETATKAKSPEPKTKSVPAAGSKDSTEKEKSTEAPKKGWFSGIWGGGGGGTPS